MNWQKIVFLLCFSLKLLASSNDNEVVDVGINLYVNEDYKCEVYCLYPLGSAAPKSQLCNLSRSLWAKDRAQEALYKGEAQVPFSLHKDHLADYDYYDSDGDPTFKKVLVLQCMLYIPPKIQKQIAEKNKEIAEKAKMEEESA